jgi:hypothetical protein
VVIGLIHDEAERGNPEYQPEEKLCREDLCKHIRMKDLFEEKPVGVKVDQGSAKYQKNEKYE